VAEPKFVSIQSKSTSVSCYVCVDEADPVIYNADVCGQVTTTCTVWKFCNIYCN